MTHKEMSSSKGRDLLTADKVANSDEKSVDALRCGRGYYEPAEKSAGQERVKELNRGFFHFNDRYLNGCTDNGDLIGNWIERQREGGQVGTNYWYRSRKSLSFKFRHQKVSRQYIQTGGTLTYAGVRIDYWVRCNLGLSESAQYRTWPFSVTQTNVTAAVEFRFQLERSIQHSRTSATGSASGNGGQP
jgi:capsule assembly protein Wzi